MRQPYQVPQPGGAIAHPWPSASKRYRHWSKCTLARPALAQPVPPPRRYRPSRPCAPCPGAACGKSSFEEKTLAVIPSGEPEGQPVREKQPLPKMLPLGAPRSASPPTSTMPCTLRRCSWRPGFMDDLHTKEAKQRVECSTSTGYLLSQSGKIPLGRRCLRVSKRSLACTPAVLCSGRKRSKRI